MIRVIVCGGRGWDDEAPIYWLLGQFYNLCVRTDQKMVLLEGGARGADAIAAEWASRYAHDARLTHRHMEADWDTHGKKAGPLRNIEMLKRLLKGPKDAERYVLAFHEDISESVGTKHMLRIARKKGVATYLMSKS